MGVKLSDLPPYFWSFFLGLMLYRRRIELRGGGPPQGRLSAILEYSILVGPPLLLCVSNLGPMFVDTLRGVDTSSYGKSSRSTPLPVVDAEVNGEKVKTSIVDLRSENLRFKVRLGGEDRGEMVAPRIV